MHLANARTNHVATMRFNAAHNIVIDVILTPNADVTLIPLLLVSTSRTHNDRQKVLTLLVRRTISPTHCAYDVVDTRIICKSQSARHVGILLRRLGNVSSYGTLCTAAATHTLLEACVASRLQAQLTMRQPM